MQHKQKMDIETRFIREMAAGQSSIETQLELADHLKNRKKPGRPTKAERDRKASAWFHIATKEEAWRCGDAYQQLAKKLCTDQRNARKIVGSKAAKADRITFNLKLESHYLVVELMRKIQDLACADVLFNGRVHRTYQHFSGKQGKDVFFYLFDKSEF